MDPVGVRGLGQGHEVERAHVGARDLEVLGVIPGALLVTRVRGRDRMDLRHERLTDLVNREAALTVIRLDERPEDPAQPVEIRPGQAWSHLEVLDVLLILPPPQVTDPQRRLHRPRQPVEIAVGPFVLTGMASVPPGAQAAGFLLRQNARYAPITRAAIRDSGLPGFEQRADVVLVNMRWVETIRDLGLDEPEAIAPPGTIEPNL